VEAALGPPPLQQMGRGRRTRPRRRPG
jgi:hypothetical protein